MAEAGDTELVSPASGHYYLRHFNFSQWEVTTKADSRVSCFSSAPTLSHCFEHQLRQSMCSHRTLAHRCKSFPGPDRTTSYAQQDRNPEASALCPSRHQSLD